MSSRSKNRTSSSKNILVDRPKPAEGQAFEIQALEKDLCLRLGAAVLSVWDKLPVGRQRSLFDAASAGCDASDYQSLRRKLAVALHGSHERTENARRLASGHPPAGPHARRDLTNFDATPGSGLLSPRRERGREVDPGAG